MFLCFYITDDYYNYYGIQDQAIPSMFYTTGFNRILKVIQNPFKNQSPVQCWMLTQILCSLLREHYSTESSKNSTPYKNSKFTWIPASKLYSLYKSNHTLQLSPYSRQHFTEGSLTEDLMQNVNMHDDKTVKSWWNGINACEWQSSKTAQTTKPKYKQLAQWQINYLTVIISQKPNPKRSFNHERSEKYSRPSHHLGADKHWSPHSSNHLE